MGRRAVTMGRRVEREREGKEEVVTSRRGLLKNFFSILNLNFEFIPLDNLYDCCICCL